MPQQVNGATDNFAIAMEFAKYFGSVYDDSNLHEAARVEYDIAWNDMSVSTSPETNIGLVNVELIDKCLRGLKLGKASGPDGLCAESLLNAHPKLKR